jgi:predicted transposase YdaD
MPANDDQPAAAPHDRFFKAAFSDPAIAADFFQSSLPAPLAAALEWATLKLESGSFVDAHLAHFASDLLFSVRFRGAALYLHCLFEHQSTPRRDMPFRLLGYMVRIWEELRKAAPAGAPCPPILPVVLYQGGAAWTASNRFLDGLAMPQELRAELTPFQPDFSHLLVDLSRVPTGMLGRQLATQLALAVMKGARSRDFLAWLGEFVQSPLMAEFCRRGTTPLFVAVVHYLLDADPHANSSTIVNVVTRLASPEIRQGFMSVTEQLIQRGRQEGLEHGTLAGKIQQCQALLRQPVSTTAELGQRDVAELQDLLRRLEAQLRSRLT